MEDWNLLSEPAQLSLASAAVRQASESLAEYAESLADEMYLGSVSDRGGPEALAPVCRHGPQPDQLHRNRSRPRIKDIRPGATPAGPFRR